VLTAFSNIQFISSWEQKQTERASLSAVTLFRRISKIETIEVTAGCMSQYCMTHKETYIKGKTSNALPDKQQTSAGVSTNNGCPTCLEHTFYTSYVIPVRGLGIPTEEAVQNYWVFGLYPLSDIPKTREHNVSETGSVSVPK
jgi:hypothetical protein